MKTNWLWDVKINEKEACRILSNEKEPRFIHYAALLISRNENVDYIFKILDKKLFCRHWPLIKEKIEQKGWFSPYKSKYWQPIYEQILKELKGNGIEIHEFPDIPFTRHQFRLAQKIRKMRKKEGLTQIQMARYIGVKQQYISKLETGRVNPSLDTIGKIANIFAKDLDIQFK